MAKIQIHWMDFLSDNLMRCVPTCPTWHRYSSYFLSWLNFTPAEHADWIKLPRQTVPPPPTNLRLNLLSFPLIFQRDQWCKTSICGHLRTTEKTAQQQQQQRHSHWIIHHSQKRFFLTVQKKKEEEKDKQTRIMPQTWETYYPMYLWLLFSWVLWQPGEKNYPCDEVMTFTENIEPQEEWLRIYSSSSLKHFNQQLMI